MDFSARLYVGIILRYQDDHKATLSALQFASSIPNSNVISSNVSTYKLMYKVSVKQGSSGPKYANLLPITSSSPSSTFRDPSKFTLVRLLPLSPLLPSPQLSFCISGSYTLI